MPATAELLTPRWRPMLMHAERRRLLESPARHRVVAAGRRSGKTEDAKRIILIGDANHPGCLNPPDVPNPRFGIFAPTREQVKDVWWKDIKNLCPKWAMAGPPNETELAIRFVNGSELRLMGLDKPQRAEGNPFDGLVVDESAEVKKEAWDSTLRPTLDNRGRPPGWSMRIGRPKGRNHFYDWWRDAKTLPDSESFHWKSSVVLAPAVIEAAKRELDPLMFAQEYEADWVNFEGLVYYCWDPNLHLRPLEYNPDLPLVFCFDFNVDPGVCAVLQEQVFPADPRLGHEAPFTASAVIAEVYIPKNSNTPAVCRKLIADWAGKHKREVYLYGDATGSQRRTSASDGNDWQQVMSYLRPHFDVRLRVERHNPSEILRVNSFNTRLKNAAGQVRMFVDPNKAPRVVRDLEGVTWLEGGDREIDKKLNPELTHLSDAIGYYVHIKHPLGGNQMRVD